jgi:hypothetical protein
MKALLTIIVHKDYTISIIQHPNVRDSAYTLAAIKMLEGYMHHYTTEIEIKPTIMEIKAIGKFSKELY